MSKVKEAAIKIVENLPEQATWDDLMYQLYVKKKVEMSLAAVDKGQVISHEDLKKRVLGQ